MYIEALGIKEHFIIFETLNEGDKEMISLWRYSKDLEGFNYALEKGGWLDCYCMSNDSQCYVAKKDFNIIGVFLFIPSRDNEFRILINPSFLSQGYGKILTIEAFKIAFESLKLESISLIVRQTHLVAISLYKKMGFIMSGEVKELTNGKEMAFFKMKKTNEMRKKLI